MTIRGEAAMDRFSNKPTLKPLLAVTSIALLGKPLLAVHFNCPTFIRYPITLQKLLPYSHSTHGWPPGLNHEAEESPD